MLWSSAKKAPHSSLSRSRAETRSRNNVRLRWRVSESLKLMRTRTNVQVVSPAYAPRHKPPSSACLGRNERMGGGVGVCVFSLIKWLPATTESSPEVGQNRGTDRLRAGGARDKPSQNNIMPYRKGSAASLPAVCLPLTQLNLGWGTLLQTHF